MAEVNVETAKNLGLTAEEFEKIIEIMGREPNFNELSIYSVMWSEHCSYKNSIKYLKTLPREGKKLLVAAGEENAGLVDIGDGLACAFKIESHNHPSALEPYQGAATGVGGIHRDIFTMGARPIAALNSLRFGDLSLAHTRRLVKGVVHGIGDYGNCLGVPTIGGETYFHPCYNQNILVNAMSIGVMKAGDTVSAIAKGAGNRVFIVGAATGKDGIHGATFASADLTEDSAEDLPSVQVGDPFQEKLLLEASLEAIATGAMVGMQDMGAAGIICSTSEMSAKGEAGMRIDLSKVPKRQQNMAPWELLLSESQERMLIVCKQGQEAILQAVFDKWDLPCDDIGEVTDTGMLEFFMDGELVAEVNAYSLVLGGGAPVYDRPYSKPEYLKKNGDFDISNIPEPQDLVAVAKQMSLLPNLVSKHWISEQYDSMVRTNTMAVGSKSDASVIRIKDTRKALAATIDCNSTYVYSDPYIGSKIAVMEAARNIVCTGGKPLAITNCLNFGNPYNEGVYYQFVEVIRGMGEACRLLDTPVTGGNVSFYNQSVIGNTTEPVHPTPSIGMVGIIEDVDHFTSLDFKNNGDVIYLLGNQREDINSSEYLREVHGVHSSPPPHFNEVEEMALQAAVIEIIEGGLINSAHDTADGGLFQTLLESSFTHDLGFDISLTDGIRMDAALFGEAQSRIVLSLNSDKSSSIEEICQRHSVPCKRIGSVRKDHMSINNINFGTLSEYKKTFNSRLKELIEQ